MIVHHYNAFTTDTTKGNPAGLVFQADDLTTAEMQELAYRVGFNETTFVCRSAVADIRLRFFTPGYEMPLCGHATIASFYALKTRGLLGSTDDPLQLTQET